LSKTKQCESNVLLDGMRSCGVVVLNDVHGGVICGIHMHVMTLDVLGLASTVSPEEEPDGVCFWANLVKHPDLCLGQSAHAFFKMLSSLYLLVFTPSLDKLLPTLQ
jgi:hypothetical protein